MKASEHKKEKMREYAKTHRKQFNEYQRKYIERLKSEGKKPRAQLDIYKSRIDKAIEYIEHKQELNKMFGYITLSEESQIELLNILKGGDNHE